MSHDPERVPLQLAGAAPTPPGGTTGERPAQAGESLSADQVDEVREGALAALRTCYDPELPVNIVDLGLVYRLEVLPDGVVEVDMTLTSPACPVAASLPGDVQRQLSALPGVTAARVNLVWDPPWTPDRMSEATRLQLGLFG